MSGQRLTLFLDRQTAKMLNLLIRAAIATQGVSPRGKVWALDVLEVLYKYLEGDGTQTVFNLESGENPVDDFERRFIGIDMEGKTKKK